MLWLCVHLPRLPAEVAERGGAAAAELFAVAERRKARPVVAAASRAAERAGVRPGMTVGAACALVPSLSVFWRAERAEQEALCRLAAWAGRFTPVVSLSFPREILLEVGGSARLFFGLDNLIARVEEGIGSLGYTGWTALAPTPLGAALLARANPGARVTALEEMERALSPLPAGVLDLPPDALATLEGLGVRSFGDCLRLPRAGLARRFGRDLPRYFDRALGLSPDPRQRYVPPSRFDARLPLFAETVSAEAVLFAARRLLEELEGYLEAVGGGARSFRFLLFHPFPGDKRSTSVEVGLAAPGRDAGRFLSLLKEKLGGTPIPAPACAVGLSVEDIVPFAPGSGGLWRGGGGEKDAEETWHALVERLRARLGDAAVRVLHVAAEHRPEHAFSLADPALAREGERKVSSCAGVPSTGSRPLWILPRPLPLGRKELSPVSGPERIESGWWDGNDVRRDYFVVRDRNGSWLWVFQERNGGRRWYLHGIFA